MCSGHGVDVHCATLVGGRACVQVAAAIPHLVAHGLAAPRIGASFERFGKSVHVLLQGLQHALQLKGFQYRGRLRADPPRDGFRVNARHPPFAADVRKHPRFRVLQAQAQAGLHQTLLLAQQDFPRKAHLERLARLVVVDHRRHMAQRLPVAEDRPDAGAGLFAQAQPAECGHDVGIAHFLGAGFEKRFRRRKGVAWIPKLHPIAEQANAGVAVLVAIVLMQQQVDRRLPKGNVVRRVVVAAKRCWIDAKRAFGAQHVALGKHEPRLHQVLFDHDAIAPTQIGRPSIERGVDELPIHHRPSQKLAHVARASEHQHRRSRGRQSPVPLDGEAPLVQKLHIGELLAPAGIAIVEYAAIPAQRIRVEELLDVQFHGFTVVVGGRIAQEPLDLRHRAMLVASAASDEGLANVPAEVDRFVAPRRLRNVEEQHGLAVYLLGFLRHRNHAVQLVASPQRAQKVVLHLVDFGHANHVQGAAGFANAKHTSHPPAVLAYAETVL